MVNFKAFVYFLYLIDKGCNEIYIFFFWFVMKTEKYLLHLMYINNFLIQIGGNLRLMETKFRENKIIKEKIFNKKLHLKYNGNIETKTKKNVKKTEALLQPRAVLNNLIYYPLKMMKKMDIICSLLIPSLVPF